MGYVEEIRSIVGHRPLILVGAVVVIADSNRILLQKRTYPNGVWGLPGGLMELSESAEDTAIREVYEETGLTVSGLKLFHVSSGPKNYCVAENGDEFFVVTIAYYTGDFSGTIINNKEESLELRFFEMDELPDQLVKSHKLILGKYLDMMSAG